MNQLDRIPFTQFLRPNGKKQEVFISFADIDVMNKAQRILNAGYVFEIEELSNGIVSATISTEDKDVAFAPFVPNGPLVPEAIKKLIMDFKL